MSLYFLNFLPKTGIKSFKNRTVRFFLSTGSYCADLVGLELYVDLPQAGFKLPEIHLPLFPKYWY